MSVASSAVAAVQNCKFATFAERPSFSDARSYAKIESCRTSPCALAFQVKTGGSMPWARSAKDIGCALTLPFGDLVRMNVKLLRRSARRALTAHSRQCTFALNAAEGVRGIRCTPR